MHGTPEPVSELEEGGRRTFVTGADGENSREICPDEQNCGVFSDGGFGSRNAPGGMSTSRDGVIGPKRMKTWSGCGPGNT